MHVNINTDGRRNHRQMLRAAALTRMPRSEKPSFSKKALHDTPRGSLAPRVPLDAEAGLEMRHREHNGHRVAVLVLQQHTRQKVAHNKGRQHQESLDVEGGRRSATLGTKRIPGTSSPSMTGCCANCIGPCPCATAGKAHQALPLLRQRGQGVARASPPRRAALVARGPR